MNTIQLRRFAAALRQQALSDQAAVVRDPESGLYFGAHEVVGFADDIVKLTDLKPKPKPVPWTISPWMHVPGNDQFLLMQGDRIVTSMFTIGEADRERFARALAWLNEQGDAV